MSNTFSYFLRGLINFICNKLFLVLKNEILKLIVTKLSIIQSALVLGIIIITNLLRN